MIFATSQVQDHCHKKLILLEKILISPNYSQANLLSKLVRAMANAWRAHTGYLKSKVNTSSAILPNCRTTYSSVDKKLLLLDSNSKLCILLFSCIISTHRLIHELLGNFLPMPGSLDHGNWAHKIDFPHSILVSCFSVQLGHQFFYFSTALYYLDYKNHQKWHWTKSTTNFRLNKMTICYLKSYPFHFQVELLSVLIR